MSTTTYRQFSLRYQNTKILRELWLESSSLDRKDFPLLDNLRSLTFLNVKGTNITGDELARLSTLMQLENLDCSSVVGVEKMLEKLKDSKALRSLHLNTCKLSANDLKTISRMHNLKFLDLTNNSVITDDTLVSLSKLTNLEQLDLTRCKITKAALPSIQKLTKLRTLNISDVDWAPQDRIFFEKALPNVNVNWSRSFVL